MDKDWHVEQLHSHCRVCGSKLRKGKSGDVKRTYECAPLASAIKSTFDVDTSTDSSVIHPTHMCRQCFNAVDKHQRAIRAGQSSVNSIAIFEWQPHSESCSVNSV